MKSSVHLAPLPEIRDREVSESAPAGAAAQAGSADDDGALQVRLAGLEASEADLRGEVSALTQKLTAMSAELEESRATATSLGGALKEAEGRAVGTAASLGAAAEARQAELSGEDAGAMQGKVRGLEEHVEALKSELASLRQSEQTSARQAADAAETVQRQRAQTVAAESGFQARLDQAQEHGRTMQRRLHSTVQELHVLKLRGAVAASRHSDGNAANAEEVKQLREAAAASRQRELAAVLLAASHRQRISKIGALCREEADKRRHLYNQLQDAKGNIRVYCRCRPLLPFEEERGDSSVVTAGDDLVRVPDAGGGARGYRFNHCFGARASQESVFEMTHDLIQSAFDGFNVCIFAYGQTGSGKTHTMYGDKGAPGLAPRTVEQIWSQIAERGGSCTVSVYMAELYMGELSDLLLKKAKGDATPPKLTVKKDAHGMVFIQNITERVVTSAKETLKLLEEGQSRRHVSGTAMNAQSSRSHLVFSMVISSTSPAGETHRGKLSLVDMAGSERVQRSEVTGTAFKEAVAINQSLSALLDVIDALAKKGQAAQSKTGVPYRNHPLTQLMSDSLGGNAKTLMFVNISPADSNIDETRAALGCAPIP